jgi:hypothetical protein
MKQLLFITLLLSLTACSQVGFTYNGLMCPTNDLNAIEADLQECSGRVYDLKEVDKALRNNPECQECLEAKGYKISDTVSDMNASK